MAESIIGITLIYAWLFLMLALAWVTMGSALPKALRVAVGAGAILFVAPMPGYATGGVAATWGVLIPNAQTTAHEPAAKRATSRSKARSCCEQCDGVFSDDDCWNNPGANNRTGRLNAKNCYMKCIGIPDDVADAAAPIR